MSRVLLNIRRIILGGLTFLSLWNLGYTGNSDVWLVLSVLSLFKFLEELDK